MQKYDLKDTQKYKAMQDFIETLHKYDLKLIKICEDDWTQLDNMQCWVFPGYVLENDGNERRILIVQSYNTIVAFEYKGWCIRCGKYSSTTSRQITRFQRVYNAL